MVVGEIVQAAHEGEHEPRLENQVERAEPAGGAETVEE
jgi:hypothetical protein